MNDEEAIRKANLRRICAARSLGPRDLERHEGLSGNYSYWRDLLAENTAKSFGEKKARQIEAALDLPPKSLDSPIGRGELRPSHRPVIKLGVPVEDLISRGSEEQRSAITDMLMLIAAKNLDGRDLEETLSRLKGLRGEE